MLIELDEQTVQKAITACLAQSRLHDDNTYHDAYLQLSKRNRIWSRNRYSTEIQQLEREKWLIQNKLDLLEKQIEAERQQV